MSDRRGSDYKKIFFSIFFILSQLILSFGQEEEGPIIEISQGRLRGTTLKSRDGREYSAFLGVPYATAKRFESPQKSGKWEGIYDATKMGEECAQSGWITNAISGIEDCLTINVYSPNVKGNYPVMVYFHGGGFTIGTGNYYKAGYFMDEDVVLVLVNYRLGVLGFLSTGDDGVICGNSGLKDQNMALRFVAENIRKFGGDPSHVTIFGGSAGGASVNYHLISPLSKGLFSAAISQSGSSLNPWAYTNDPNYVKNKYAQAVNCPLDSKLLLACLKKKSTHEILDGMKATVEWGYDPFTPFGPVVESKNCGPHSFLQQRPEILLEKGQFNKVNWIIGLDEDEGILMHSGWILHHENLTMDLRKNWKKIFPITLQYSEQYGKFSQKTKDEASKRILEYYFNDDKLIGGKDKGSEQALTDLYGDRFFNHGVKKAALLAAKYVPVYAYIFAFHRKDFSMMEFFGIKTGSFGVTHHDEMSFLFSDTYGIAPDFRNGSTGEKMSRRMVKLWVSIARDNKPTSLWSNVKTWEPMSPAEISGQEPLKYLWIDDTISVREEPFTERLNFWDRLEIDVLIQNNEKSGEGREEL